MPDRLTLDGEGPAAPFAEDIPSTQWWNTSYDFLLYQCQPDTPLPDSAMPLVDQESLECSIGFIGLRAMWSNNGTL